jgi:hypothetical protein
MAEMGGYGGNVVFAAGDVVNVKAWNMDYTVDVLDTTDFGGAGEGDAIRGVRRCSGTYTTSLDSAAPTTAPGASGAATFTLTGARTVTGTILLTGVHIGAAVADLLELTCDFTFQGAPALN